MNFKSKLIVPLLVVIFVFPFSTLAQKKPVAKPAAAQRNITVSTEPNATVWVDDVKRGVTDTGGKLAGVKLSPASRVLRVRANGFKQAMVNLTPAAKGIVKVKLAVTGDNAELLFQKAEALRESTIDEAERGKAVELYKQALKLRPKFPEAHLGLARVYFDLKNTEAAMAEIIAARKDRPVYPEASAVEGRIYHEDIDDEMAVKSYNRAIKEGRGYQPEAHTGLAIIYKEQEKNDEAIKEFKIAISQLFGTEPILYQLLGDLYEKMRNYKEAINTYEAYLKAAPNGKDVSAIQSIIVQLKKELEQPD
jgi:tetratricopeptide (TPR) repeat protein